MGVFRLASRLAVMFRHVLGGDGSSLRGLGFSLGEKSHKHTNITLVYFYVCLALGPVPPSSPFATVLNFDLKHIMSSLLLSGLKGGVLAQRSL